MVEREESRWKWSPLIVGLLSLVVHLALLAGAGRDPSFSVPLIDAKVYDAFARGVVFGTSDQAQPFFQPPLFPLLLAGIYAVFGAQIMAAKVILSLVGVWTCLLVHRVARELFGDVVALIAGIVAALYGPLVFFDTRLLPAGLAAFLAVAALNVMLAAARRGGARGLWFAAGLLVGLCILAVPVHVVLLAAGGIWLLVGIRKAGARITGMKLALFVLGAVLVVSPVTIRNRVVSGQWVFISTNGGINLFLANNPDAPGTLGVRPGLDWDYIERMPLRAGMSNAADADRWFRRRVAAYVTQHPSAFWRGYAYRLFQLVNARELPRTLDVYSHRPFSPILSVLVWRGGPFSFPWGVVFPLAVLGAVVSVRRDRRAWMLILYAFLYGLVTALFFVSARHRLPVVPVMAVFAGYGAWWLYALASGRDRWAGLVLVLAVCAVVNLPVRAATDGFDFDAERSVLIGIREAEQGSPMEAERHYRRALQINPDYVDAYNQLGNLRLMQNRLQEAADYYSRAVEISPDFAEAYNNLGLVRIRMGQLRAAREPLRRAIRIRPELAKAHGNIGVSYLVEGRTKDALPALRRAVDLDPLDAEWANYLAWVLATHPDEQFRDGAEAVRIAEAMVAAAGKRDPMLLDTLAAAYAEAGRFEEASAAAELAAQRAIMQGSDVLSGKSARRAMDYRQERPYRDRTLLVPGRGGGK